MSLAHLEGGKQNFFLSKMIENFEKEKPFKQQLEQQELEAANGDVPVTVYVQLLALYLKSNDLLNAKFLWQRIPSSIAEASAILQRLWEVCKAALRRDHAEVHTLLNSPEMAATCSNCCEAEVAHIEALSDVARLLHMEVPAALSLAKSRGWQVDNSSQMVKPTQSADKAPSLATTPPDGDLTSLTQLISYLES